MNSLSFLLKQLMTKQNLSTAELARRTGIGQPVIYRIASGETLNATVHTVWQLADYFHLSIDQLVGREPLSAEYLTEDICM